MADTKRMREKLADMQAQVSSLDGLKRRMADDLLDAYVRVFADYERLDRRLSREGLLVEVEKGGADNRHVVTAKNPAFDMRRNCISQMADLANKINRFVKDGESSETDAFDEF